MQETQVEAKFAAVAVEKVPVLHRVQATVPLAVA